MPLHPGPLHLGLDALLGPEDVVLPVPVVDERDGGYGGGPHAVQVLRSRLQLRQPHVQPLNLTMDNKQSI